VQGSDGSHWHRHMFLDLCCQINITSVLFKHRRMGITESSLVSSCRHMEKIYVRLDLLCDLHSPGQIISSPKQFGTSHPELNREFVSHCLTHRLQHLYGKPAPVLQTASIFICTLIKIRGEELIDQPAVASMDHQHFKSRPFCQSRCFAVGLHDLPDQ